MYIIFINNIVYLFIQKHLLVAYYMLDAKKIFFF